MAKHAFSLVPDVFTYDQGNTEEVNKERAKINKDPLPPTLKRLENLGLNKNFDGKESTASETGSQPWARIHDYIDALNKKGGKHKVVFVVRHGFSLHNYIERGVAKAKEVGGKKVMINNWREGAKLAYKGDIDLKSLEEAFEEAGGQVSPHLKTLSIIDHTKTGAEVPLLDAPLLEKDDVQKLLGSGASKNDAGDLGDQWLSWVKTNKMPLPDAIYTSPLRRCLKTTEKVYSRAFEAHAKERQTFRPIVKENLREIRNGDACNYRSSRLYIANHFPAYELGPDFAGDDPYKRDIDKVERGDKDAKESDEKLEGRVRQVLNDIFDDNGTKIVSLTTHSFSIGALTKVIGYQCILHEGDITAFLVKATPL